MTIDPMGLLISAGIFFGFSWIVIKRSNVSPEDKSKEWRDVVNIFLFLLLLCCFIIVLYNFGIIT
jgi:hypothetical protein